MPPRHQTHRGRRRFPAELPATGPNRWGRNGFLVRTDVFGNGAEKNTETGLEEGRDEAKAPEGASRLGAAVPPPFVRWGRGADPAPPGSGLRRRPAPQSWKTWQNGGLFSLSLSLSIAAANLVLHQTVERIHVGKKYGDIPRGIFVVRGENVVLLGEIDLEKESDTPLQQVSIEEILEEQRVEQQAKQESEKLKVQALKERGLCVPRADTLDEY
ncbi:PREDICTED: U6 snRNA-associated Sm-like protein LSm1 [Calidris pugnax]|nr:PREDICTED: U6 snRNA-associated Sm-like protein LSm1 [Calidris pugnax]